MRCALLTIVLTAFLAAPPAGPPFVDITWMSFSNMLHEIGSAGVLIDGYITRIPPDAFADADMRYTKRPLTPDVPAVTRVFEAIGGKGRLSLLLTGHSHFDHSFDTAAWAKLSGAPVAGSKTTCFQVRAQGIPSERCKALEGGEEMSITEGVTMYVVRWNHSGDAKTNAHLHNPLELEAAPKPDPATGGLRAGVFEDFPNGGGGRAYLFVVDGPDGRYSWFFNNSASASDFEAPLANLQAAMKRAGISAVDLWIGSGGVAVAQMVVPVLRPRYFIPVHWDGLFTPFEAGVVKPYADPPLEAFLSTSKVALVRPAQYMDKWRLSRAGVSAVDNSKVKARAGVL